jgi:hypothetical protein
MSALRYLALMSRSRPRARPLKRDVRLRLCLARFDPILTLCDYDLCTFASLATSLPRKP